MSRRGYHHGNLREALIEAALTLIGKKGHAGFTFADAARMAGVSPAAPYRHYRDRDALMADVALRGFELFEHRLARAWNNGTQDSLRKLRDLGDAYLAFVQDEPAYYSAMFEAGVVTDAEPELKLASHRAFEVLKSAAEAIAEKLPSEGRPPAMMIALHLWSITHGIASLFGRGDATRRKIPMTPGQLLEAGVLVYLRGLGFGNSG